jgi:arsenate reductase (thioredoxin)
MEPKTKVLFLCTGNSARSQIGEALLRQHAGNHFEVYSAGLEPKGINPYTIKVLNEFGLDISGQRSKNVREYLGHVHFGYTITVCGDADAKCPTVFPGIGQRLRWFFDDPAAVDGDDEQKLQAFRITRDRINARIIEWLKELGLPDEASVQSTHA